MWAGAVRSKNVNHKMSIMGVTNQPIHTLKDQWMDGQTKQGVDSYSRQLTWPDMQIVCWWAGAVIKKTYPSFVQGQQCKNS